MLVQLENCGILRKPQMLIWLVLINVGKLDNLALLHRRLIAFVF